MLKTKMENSEYFNLVSQYLQNEEELMIGSAGILAFLDELPSSSSSESSSRSEESEREETSKCQNFCQVIDGYGENKFKSHMRLRRSTVEILIEKYTNTIEPKTNTGGREIVPPRKKNIYIWYISNTVTFRELANLFGVSSSTAWTIVSGVTSWVISISHEYVRWPNSTVAVATKRKFEARCGLPNVIGCIDCTHIRIKAPRENKENYFDRKHTYSIVLQAVVDADKRFVDVTCGEPGSLHDSRVLRRSHLFALAQTDSERLFPNEAFILGDSAYPATNWLVPPFKDYGNLTASQRNLNKLHSSTRIAVENAFVNIIVSACVLHNICITVDDLSIENDQDEDLENSLQDESHDVHQQTNSSRRDELFQYLQHHNLI
ncbi:uncharacterized protein LOC128922625 isoform X2 [Zeugodacus cucurbitae]|uniref:uncharacterized protein LOC128922625 isoform X2 n=1 Tax=Zeugodacus cucurbitae TaxID=28588 RepID=UPI0023D9103D|nr:uncharacterized protein LOC128922625 isoform X2 [Zeugodacus cucurbitae]